MTDLLFPLPSRPSLPVQGHQARFPVRRIFCVGRNYAEHAREMGAPLDRTAAFFFTKSAWSVAEPGTIAYPPGTADLHHEVELVVALGPGATGGVAVWGYGCGLDMTRRDLQAAAKDQRRPWDMAKDFEGSAVIGPLTPCGDFKPAEQEITLSVNGERRQSGRLSDMVFPVEGLIEQLSRYYTLQPGDLIMTGTPSGVGPVTTGDRIEASIEGLVPLSGVVGERSQG